uniref:E2F-associated phosphoprotein isoform X2 n=1 Tax=Cicer arietinum TaxID=3827 RepID=A0A3Q7X7Z1_CICAR|nr:E2F-associated phosphoprotein isoform X2 [Cicer arietinum]
MPNHPPIHNKPDEKWIHKKKHGCDSDAVLCCPACFTTLCLECQRHEKYLTQYRAIFVVNCKIENKQVPRQSSSSSRSRKRNRSNEAFDGSDAVSTSNETLKQVCCSICSTEVGVIDEDEVYHFFNVLPSES